MMTDPVLIEYASDRQREYIELLSTHGTYRAAARAAGVHADIVRKSMKRLRKHAELKGYSPEHEMIRSVPDSYVIRRRSQNFVDGALKQEWVVSSPDAEKRAAAIDAAFAAAAEQLPREAPTPLVRPTDTALCNLYTFTDCHLGMMVRAAVGGRDWDTKIAEETLYRCLEQMVLRSPDAHTGILNQLGDFLHSDGLKALTPTSGHLLDVSDTYQEMAKVAVRVLRRMVNLMLTKHQKVHIVMAEGNHDMAGSVWLRVMFSVLYENEPRVTVDTSELPFYVYQHGKTMLAFHHGHMKKKELLPGYFAAQFYEMWGRTTKRYCHTGHYHHEQQVFEFNGMKVVQHPTLAPNDAHSARHAYVSHNQAASVTYHSEFGKVGEVVIYPEMLSAA